MNILIKSKRLEYWLCWWKWWVDFDYLSKTGVELGNIDLVESRLKSFRRTYATYLKQIQQERVLTYLGLVESYHKNPAQVTSKNFKEKVEHSFEWLEAKREDIFVMSFYAWLKSKMDRKPLFSTTLELIKLSQGVN